MNIARERLLGFNPEIRGLRRTLERAERALERARESYAEDHPSLITAQDDYARARTGYRAEGDGAEELTLNDIIDLADRGGDAMQEEIEAYTGARDEMEGLRPQVELLAQQLEELWADLREYAGNDQILTQLMRDVEAKSSAYTRLYERYQDAIATQALSIQEEARQVWVIEEPMVPRGSGRVGLKKAGVAGIVLGLLLMFVVIVAAEFLDPSVRLPDEATSVAAGVPVILNMPHLEYLSS